jgi:16S rRNA processing protein RimM
MIEYTQIGFVKKAHGTTGEIKVAVDEVYEDLFLSAKRVFVDMRGTKMPLFIQQVRGAGEWIVQFEGYKNRDQIMLIQSRAIWLPASEVPADVALEADEDELLYGYLVGYMLADKHTGDVGVIEEVLDMPQQEMAVIQYQNREVLIPLHDTYIITIDKTKKRVFADLPEGLLDL